MSNTTRAKSNDKPTRMASVRSCVLYALLIIAALYAHACAVDFDQQAAPATARHV